MEEHFRKGPIAVIGAGAWGTALALLLSRNGYEVRLWGRDPQLMVTMQTQHCNPRYLPSHGFNAYLKPCITLKEAVQGSAEVLIVVPSCAFAETLLALKPWLSHDTGVLWGTKGIDPTNKKLLHVIAQDILGTHRSFAVLSGPSFSNEVAQGLPTAVTIASYQLSYAQMLCRYFHNEFFRPYLSEDVVGVEVGGAIKNVLAIAVGISDGLGYGANARSALITRGLMEMVRLGVALGGKQQTFYGLTGVGDLILTATDDQSRNRRFGVALGQGLNIAAAKASISQVIEGYDNSRHIFALAQQLKVDAPIIEQVAGVLYDAVSPQEAVMALLARDIKEEFF